MHAGERFGPYALLERLHGGGVAVERWRAIQLDPFAPGRPLLLKRVRPGTPVNGAFYQAFGWEARLRAQVQDKGLPALVDSGLVAEVPFVAVEHGLGVTLHDLSRAARRQGGLLPVPMSLWVVAQIARTLDRLHFADDDGDVRVTPARDVHPRYILIGEDGEPRYLGLDCVTALDVHAPSSPDRLFHQVYLSPEQLLGDPVDHRTDVFALGAVLYELLTGEAPFEADSDLAALLRLRDVDVTPPSVLNPDVSGDVEAVVLRCLAQQPERRYPRASDLSAELQGVLSSLDAVDAAAVLGCARSLCESQWREEEDKLADAGNWEREELEGALHNTPRWDDDTIPDHTLEELPTHATSHAFANQGAPDRAFPRPPNRDRRSPVTRPLSGDGRKVRAP